MRRAVITGLLLSAYLAIIIPFSGYLQSRPLALKLGYLPEAEVLKLVVGEHRYVFAQAAVVRVLFYYSSMTDQLFRRVKFSPEYFNMFKTLQTAVKLDPYNMDAYYFTQAAFVWELKRIKEVNDLLDYGMTYRTWDPMLPFYAGFNAAYFQKDYATASRYMQRASELSHDPFYATLTSRYFYQAGQTEMGIAFLRTMKKDVKDPKIRRVYDVREAALLAVQEISAAVTRFRERYGRQPSTVEEMVTFGVLPQIPSDPYGGRFYLDGQGTVATTSKFAFGGGGNGK